MGEGGEEKMAVESEQIFDKALGLTSTKFRPQPSLNSFN